MIVFLIALCAISFWGIEFSDNSAHYLDKNYTNSIKGIFILIVLLNHSRSYLSLGGGAFNQIYALFFHLVGQMMVVMFLFYSGYGIAFRYAHKGEEYKNGFLKQRLFLTWIHFVFAVAIYAVINLLTRTSFPLKKWILSWFGWEAIGNSNWFIFDILALYLLTYVAMRMDNDNKQGHRKFTLIVLIGTLLLWCGLFFTKRPSRYWYDTLLAYPFGIWFFYNKKKIQVILSSNKAYWGCLIGAIVSFLIFSLIRNSLGGNLAAIAFALIVVLVTFKVKIGNKITIWLGEHLFPVYILQRIPMNILSRMDLEPVLFVALSIIITIALVYPFDFLCRKIDKLVLS